MQKSIETTPSPKSSLSKLVLYPKPKSFKVMVLGQSGVGKSALVVRFITRRFIGEYDPNLEKIYSYQTVIDNEMVYFEILDSAAAESQEGEYTNLENNIRWADMFILMYSVTDKCSFDECHRLKFLINYNKRRRRLASSIKENTLDTPVVMVGNKSDQPGDRMVSTEEGQRRSKETGCVCFHEISVRESIDQVSALRYFELEDHKQSTRQQDLRPPNDSYIIVLGVFRDTRRFWRVSKWTALARPLARASSDATEAPPTAEPFCRRCAELDVEEEDECEAPTESDSGEFRARASTDSRLPPRMARARHPYQPREHAHCTRRMSVAMQGSNTNTY